MRSFSFVVGAVHQTFQHQRLFELQSDAQSGAVLSFCGQVRADEHDSAIVSAIDYTCYKEMALELGQELLSQIASRHHVRSLGVWHSIGLVPTSGCSLFVLCAGAHRAEVFAAMMECITTIKQQLPIWGEEVLSDGTRRGKKSESAANNTMNTTNTDQGMKQ